MKMTFKYRMWGYGKDFPMNIEVFLIFSVTTIGTYSNKLSLLTYFTFLSETYTHCFLAFKKLNIHDHVIEGVSCWFGC